MKKLLLGIGILLAVRCVAGNDQVPSSPPVAWEVVEGIQSPESVYLDEESGFLFVSNVGAGGATEKDGDGYISKLTPAGKMLEAKWVVGLNSPKGLRSQGGTLWVSDIDRLVGIDIAQGTVRYVVEVEGARFLNDVATDKHGAVYVSDMLANKIYRYKDGQLSVFADGDHLESPNGLLVHGNRLVVAAWGSGIRDDFSTETPGRLFTLNAEGKGKELITANPSGNFDGVEPFGDGGYLVSDWYAGKVYLIRPDGAKELVLQLPQGAADLTYLPKQRLLIVPQMLENKVTAFEYPASAP
ncbi:MAG: hypothetical protein U1E05_23230 [Patescibacteria group bacterium]|nr:hypothetical protein [Patescibacteria group bacterium]